MGVKINDGVNWNTVTAPAKYSTDGGVTWYGGKRLNFLDPVTGNYMRGVWGDVNPSDINSPSVAFAWNGSAYVATATWAQVPDTEGDFTTLEWKKVVTGGATTTGSVAYSSLTHPAGVTNYVIGTISDAGYTEITWSFRIVDSGGQAGNWAAAPAVRVPPGVPTSVAIANVYSGGHYIGRVTWSAPAGTVSSYRIVWTRNGGGGGTINGATSPTDLTTGVVGGDVISATVYAIDPAATVSPGVTVALTTPPDAPTSPTLTNLNTPTATLSWTAPATGVLTGYRYRFSTDGVSYGSWTSVGTGTLSATYSIAGVSTLYAQVEAVNTPSTPQTNSATASTSGTVLPPTPTTAAPTFANNSTIAVSWTLADATNVAYFDVYFAINGGGWVRYATGLSAATRSYSTSVGMNNNTTQYALVYAYHANGQYAGTQASAATPSSVGAPTARFASGKVKATWTHLAGNTGYYVKAYRTSDNALVESATLGAVGTWTGASAGTYATNSTYRVTVQGFNSAGTAAAVSSSTNVKKIANPIAIDADASETWRGGVDRNVGNLYQGRFDTSTSGNFGAFYYGNKFRDNLHQDYIGWRPVISEATIFFMRLDGIGNSPQIAPVLYLHTKTADGSDPQTGAGGGVAMPIGLTRPANSSGGVPPWYAQESFSDAGNLIWIDYLIDQVNSWKGIGIYGTGTSTLYSAFYAAGNYVLFVGTSGTVTIYHDG